VLLLNEYELIVTHTWGSKNNVSHKVSGHTFEVIDYFVILHKSFNCGILLVDTTKDTFMSCIRSKYDFDESFIEYISNRIIECDHPNRILGHNILFTDGCWTKLDHKSIVFKNIFTFVCSDNAVFNDTRPNVHVLSDKRIHPNENVIDYKKKILFSHLKQPTKTSDDTLLYSTSNCRRIPNDMFDEIIDSYGGDFLCVTDTLLDYSHDRMTIVNTPVSGNIFELFDTYIYTPTLFKTDCSPRFIAECKFFNKKVIFHNINYWNDDLGLKYRVYDVEHDFQSLHLTKNDEIIRIINDRL